MLEKHQRRPELDAKGSPQLQAAAVFDFDVGYLRIICESLSDERLCRLAVTAPRGAELQHSGDVQCIDFSARWFFRDVTVAQSHSGPPTDLEKSDGLGTKVILHLERFAVH
jgi:hypothetical protein